MDQELVVASEVAYPSEEVLARGQSYLESFNRNDSALWILSG
jgi:hypothetical protein